jgi:hypothetical protein
MDTQRYEKDFDQTTCCDTPEKLLKTKEEEEEGDVMKSTEDKEGCDRPEYVSTCAETTSSVLYVLLSNL